jgi:protein TonB
MAPGLCTTCRMMPEATAREEATRAASTAAGGAARLVQFLGASAVLHGILAVALWSGAPAEAPASPQVSAAAAAGTEMVWFEGAAQIPAPAKAPGPVPRDTPKVRPKAVPVTRSVSPRPEAEQRVEQKPAPPVAASPAVESPQSHEPPAEKPAGASLAETAVRGSAEGAPDAEVGTPGGEAGTSASGGGVGSQSTAAPGNSGPGGPARGDLRAYARSLSAAVNRHRHYPEVAARLGMEGRALIHLRVRRDGSLMEPPRLVSSSGHEVLDAEALRMAEAAAPFEPMPESASRTDAGFIIGVEFFLHRK